MKRRPYTGVDSGSDEDCRTDDAPPLKGKIRRPGPDVKPDVYFRDLYRNPPNFRALARKDPDFSPFVKNGVVDFRDPATTVQLTKSLAKVDFDISLELPDDRLCPPVPNRHNYILWIKGLLDTSSYDPPGGEMLGLDIGTGASCIYPLLGCAQRPWKFVATEIDPKNHAYAAKNISLNGLDKRIMLLPLRNASQPLLPLPLPDGAPKPTPDFTMTNPPFYESREELERCAAAKNRPPRGACTGSDVEMVVEGGELQYVGRIIEESLQLREEGARWYTAMLGKLSSVDAVVERLRAGGIGNWAVTELVQGKSTRRWAVAWSFGTMRPAQAVARGTTSPANAATLPPATEARLAERPEPGKLGDVVRDAVSSLELASWRWDGGQLSGMGTAAENVWGRAWRRRKAREVTADDGVQGPRSQATISFGFTIQVLIGRGETRVRCRWTEGDDPALFESFCGWLRRKLEEA